MGGGMGGHGPMDGRRPPSMDTQRGYMGLVAGYIELSRDSSGAGIASVLTAADVLKPRGNAAAIEYFNNLLPNVKDPAIDRAIRLQLVDLYRATNQSDEALKHLEKLITADAPAK
jgi:predicted negative regulator of RcsB-dependent stress response